MDSDQTRLVGDYVLGPRIGSGSYAVVWRAKHRKTGMIVAVKEIDISRLPTKVCENLHKEISILSTVNHPNIIRLFEAIESKKTIYLVLEYCEGGDLAGYLHRRGKVSEAVARHFMRQLAAGLQVLQEKHFVHRDLKPQNLLLSSNETAPQMKIGDFGFARSLTPCSLADTFCGSPLYMAPEIIQHRKYNAKADLWSVGAILFQMVTGKPPFGGNNENQLYLNILTSTELKFPKAALKELHPDCVDLCRRLLCQNPVERLTFLDFFNHKFLREPRPMVDAEQSSPVLPGKAVTERFDFSASAESPNFLPEHPIYSSEGSPQSIRSSVHDESVVLGKNHVTVSGNKSTHVFMENTISDGVQMSSEWTQRLSNQFGVADSMESIEKDYVFVSRHCASLDNFSYYVGTSIQDNSTTMFSACPSNSNDQDMTVIVETAKLAVGLTSSPENLQVNASDPTRSCISLDPSTRLQLLHQCLQVVTELAQEKYNAGLFLESFSIELVVLAIWKRALQIANSWLMSIPEGGLAEHSSVIQYSPVLGNKDFYTEDKDKLDFVNPSSVHLWAEQGFIAAYDHAERLSCQLKGVDAATEMPDAMELIFQKALAIGKSGAVDEYMENVGSAAVSYSRAMLLLSFILEEATSLPLNPPFSLTPSNSKRIHNYIISLQSHQSHFLTMQRAPKEPF
ncbi:hypothetical protein K2173_004950 [Erythroxylum novogranatense]|uniref:Protein kinase domain-containing protein n=1 Tax=Erythroxylum novogranatense TaxID=1862640 RepID=A0AAV8U8D7_9ROSI|nr:hypothetical protein K2173_004950 [Erythroxylum novogranatense]